MRLELRLIRDLLPADYNPRRAIKKGSKLWKDLEASIEEFGFVQPVIWNQRSGRIVGGHQRITVLQARGVTEVETVIVDLDDTAEKKLNILLNRVGEGNWHPEKLRDVLGELKSTVDLESLGFTALDLASIMRKSGSKKRVDPDREIPVGTMARTKRGDLYELISTDGVPIHRVLCGDSESVEEMQTLVDGRPPRLVFTDPPYGVSYVSKGKKGKMARRDLQNDELRDKVLTDFLTRLFLAAAAVSDPEAAIYTFYASRTHIAFEEALVAAGWEVRQQLIWQKQMALGRSDYHWAHEPCLYGGRKGKKPKWFGARTETTVLDTSTAWEKLDKKELIALLVGLRDASTVWDVKRDNPAEYIHPTQKPIALASRAILNSTGAADTVLDICGGSGSTLIAAEETGRSSYTMEKDPLFVDAIVTRYATVYDTVAIRLNGQDLDVQQWRLP